MQIRDHSDRQYRLGAPDKHLARLPQPELSGKAALFERKRNRSCDDNLQPAPSPAFDQPTPIALVGRDNRRMQRQASDRNMRTGAADRVRNRDGVVGDRQAVGVNRPARQEAIAVMPGGDDDFGRGLVGLDVERSRAPADAEACPDLGRTAAVDLDRRMRGGRALERPDVADIVSRRTAVESPGAGHRATVRRPKCRHARDRDIVRSNICHVDDQRPRPPIDADIAALPKMFDGPPLARHGNAQPCGIGREIGQPARLAKCRIVEEGDVAVGMVHRPQPTQHLPGEHQTRLLRSVEAPPALERSPQVGPGRAHLRGSTHDTSGSIRNARHRQGLLGDFGLEDIKPPAQPGVGFVALKVGTGEDQRLAVGE